MTVTGTVRVGVAGCALLLDVPELLSYSLGVVTCQVLWDQRRMGQRPWPQVTSFPHHREVNVSMCDRNTKEIITGVERRGRGGEEAGPHSLGSPGERCGEDLEKWVTLM